MLVACDKPVTVGLDSGIGVHLRVCGGSSAANPPTPLPCGLARYSSRVNRGRFQATAHLADRFAKGARSQIEAVAQKLVGMPDFDTEGFDSRIREVPQVRGHDGVAASGDGRREDMPIARVGKIQCRDESLVYSYPVSGRLHRGDMAPDVVPVRSGSIYGSMSMRSPQGWRLRSPVGGPQLHQITG